VDPVGLRSMYDEAKRFSEALIMAYFRSKSTDTRIVRIFNTYGPRMRADDGRVVPNFINQALRGEPLTIYGDGLQTRSFCYVDDLVDGIYRLLLSKEHLPINIGNPTETSILRFAETINHLTGNTAGLDFQSDKRLGNDPQRRCPDISRARSILGWLPKVDLEEGLLRTIASFREKLKIK
jgi:dTDP-glucose 4,6-dehydratase